MEVVEALCAVEVDRRPGGTGNDQAVGFVAEAWLSAGWEVATPEFDCLNWHADGATVHCADREIHLSPSPYGLGVDAAGPIRVVTAIEDIGQSEIGGSVAVITGELAKEPITPKAFPFYGSDQHSELIAALESARPAAVIGVTGKYPELCGALDPFPLFEDGDFEIPASSVRPEHAELLISLEGQMARIRIDAARIPSKARNVVARRGASNPRLTVCAHIDTKPGTPGAVDNATGVAVLVLVADRLAQLDGLPIGVELLAVNGEDHFAAPGELAWLEANSGRLDEIELFLNVDGAGYREGGTAYSFYNVDPDIASMVRESFSGFQDLVEGPQWFQSDHAILAMQGRPAMAFTTECLQQLLEDSFHSAHDTIDQVEPDRLVSLADALAGLIEGWPSRAA